MREAPLATIRDEFQPFSLTEKDPSDDSDETQDERRSGDVTCSELPGVCFASLPFCFDYVSRSFLG